MANSKQLIFLGIGGSPGKLAWFVLVGLTPSGGVITDSIAADAIIETSKSNTLTTDSTILRGRSGSFTADAIVETARTDSMTADAILQATNSKTLSADASIWRAGTGTITADAVVERSVADSITSDAAIERSQASSVTADALIEVMKSGSVTADGAIMRAVEGTTCWGHITGVTETNTKTFSGNWLGTGAVSGSGDSEELVLDDGEWMNSQVVTVTGTVRVRQNTYASGNDVTLRYRTGATRVACMAADWITYTVPFESAGYVQVRAENNPGLLTVNETNARYFQDSNGKTMFLVGSHTWDNRQDQGTGAFGWDTYLDNLVSWGHNFIRFWVWEQPKPPNGLGGAGIVHPTTTLTPELWKRTGPGNAYDGGLKFDLAQYNATHLSRLRDRCIDAGAHGMYVSIMLFNGWSVADKGGSTDPWPYHPFNVDNNVSSIDGDTNDDGDGYEVQNDSVAAITTAQEAYVAEIIDTVNDLTNVMYEICNEPNGNVSGTADWVAGMISYIHTYEASKAQQHPVWYTVEWPGGSNAVLLASDAEVIGPNADVTFDGTKVVIADTDHYFGIGGSADWAWKLFTSGIGGICYMDSWNNDFLDCSGSGHPIQNLRDNLGYILDMAELANIAGTVPQGGGGSPCSTGYCLYGGSQYVCYQPSNGNATLDLTGESGTFSIRKVNLADGTINTSQTVEGGASRTITQPTGWTSGWGFWVRK